RQLPDGLQYNIRSLVLSHNRFHSLDGKLQQYTHLRSLDLSHNRLSRLPKTLPRSLWQLSWNLQTLDLSNNKLERAIFINNTLINLLTLNLSHNHFWTLPTNLPHHLETIDLSHNLLVKVLPGSLDRLPRLIHFYLHANRFSSLPSGVLDNMVSLRIITLSSNPWACHLYEDMAYLLSWAQTYCIFRTIGHLIMYHNKLTFSKLISFKVQQTTRCIRQDKESEIRTPVSQTLSTTFTLNLERVCNMLHVGRISIYTIPVTPNLVFYKNRLIACC
uniref:Oligodendrocyte myelin glycoprotein a n=1 Tax=Oryzias sinensis TaxID=183150 RepID=A0A8C8DYJ9_9TELE